MRNALDISVLVIGLVGAAAAYAQPGDERVMKVRPPHVEARLSSEVQGARSVLAAIRLDRPRQAVRLGDASLHQFDAKLFAALRGK